MIIFVQLPNTACQSRQTKRTSNVSWQAEYARLVNEIQVRHYSPKTLKAYRGWVQKFQSFTKSKSPELISTEDVKEYLTFLAVKRRVSASTQNQAFNALLFLFRHVLGKEFGKVDGVVRAKRKPYIPVVLSREEIDVILKHLSPHAAQPPGGRIRARRSTPRCAAEFRLSLHHR
ncbi:MAG: phage integrase N-terminal SAM-like domain-containing protein [Deltaproteobacteria bacterium]|nr:phage integrase N-terminal SAM-like domain-containing protein [Deltaproteobacteria bacterium]